MRDLTEEQSVWTGDIGPVLVQFALLICTCQIKDEFTLQAKLKFWFLFIKNNINLNSQKTTQQLTLISLYQENNK